MLKRLLLFALLPLLAISCCTRENLDDCGRGFRLQFRYTHNNQDADLLLEQVQHIRIYLFDQNTSVLTGIISAVAQDITRGYIDIDISEGLYTIIAWGSSSANMIQDGYMDAQVTDPATNTYVPVAIGTTTLDDFRMMLAYDPLVGNTLASVTPKVADFADLFYASVTDVSVTGSGRRQVVNLDLIKNTSTLKVVVTGLNYLSSRATAAALPIEIFSTGANWLYEYNNQWDVYAPRMLYVPYESSLNANADAIEVLIKQQRLNTSQRVIAPVLLYIRNTTGADLITPMDIIAAIQQNPAYQTQAAIDREDLFTVTIAIEPGDSVNLTVTVTINGWQLANTETILV